MTNPYTDDELKRAIKQADECDRPKGLHKVISRLDSLEELSNPDMFDEYIGDGHYGDVQEVIRSLEHKDLSTPARNYLFAHAVAAHHIRPNSAIRTVLSHLIIALRSETRAPANTSKESTVPNINTFFARAIEQGKEGAKNGAGFAAGKEIRNIVLQALPEEHRLLVQALPDSMQVLLVALMVDALATFAPIPAAEYVSRASQAAIAGSATVALANLDLDILKRIANIGRRLAGERDDSNLEEVARRAAEAAVRAAQEGTEE